MFYQNDKTVGKLWFHNETEMLRSADVNKRSKIDKSFKLNPLKAFGNHDYN